MTVLNQPELEAQIATINDGGANTAAEVRSVFQDMLDSLQSYGGVIKDGQLENISISSTPRKWVEYTQDITSPNDILEADFTNGRVLVKEPGLYYVTLRFFGKWNTGEDLGFELRVNGVANPLTPVKFETEGKGASDPETISVTRIGFVVNSAMVAGGPGGNAAIELYADSQTGTFNVDQEGITLGVEYNPLSIRTVG